MTIERIPALDQATRELRLHGMGPVLQWQPLLQGLAGHVRSRDQAVAAKRDSAKGKRWIGIGIALLVGIAAGFLFKHFMPGLVIAGIGVGAVALLIRVPKADYVGPERADFVRRLVDDLAKIAPASTVGLSAQLDGRHGVPAVALKSSSTMERGEREDAWLRG